MVPLSIPGLPHAGNLSSLLWAVPGPWLSSGGLRMLCGGRSRRAGQAASTPSRLWVALCLSPRVPHDVLTPSSLLLRPPLLPRCCRAVGTGPRWPEAAMAAKPLLQSERR
jgi:hypothetical protein